MAGCVKWLRREVSQLEARASGRVTPQLLAPVRVSVAVSVSAGQSTASSAAASASASEAKRGARLEELATVGVRDGTTLVVTVFDPQVCCVVVVLVASCDVVVVIKCGLLLLPLEFEACSRRFIRCQDKGCHSPTGR